MCVCVLSIYKLYEIPLRHLHDTIAAIYSSYSNSIAAAIRAGVLQVLDAEIQLLFSSIAHISGEIYRYTYVDDGDGARESVGVRSATVRHIIITNIMWKIMHLLTRINIAYRQPVVRHAAKPFPCQQISTEHKSCVM